MLSSKGIKPIWSNKEIERFFDKFEDRAIDKLYMFLQRAGEEFVKIARTKGNYKDYTGNLRSSIGYVIVNNGKIVHDNFAMSGNGIEKIKGVREAKKLTLELAEEYNRGWVLIGVAAMEYAWYVESIHHRDVATTANELTEDWIRIQSITLFNKMAQKGF